MPTSDSLRAGSSVNDRPPRLRPGGGDAFTVVELAIGLVILSMTALALAGTMSSVSQGWTTTRQAQAEVMTQHTAGLRIERLIAGSKAMHIGDGGSLLGLGPPSIIVLWRKDDALHGAQPELYETALLVHSPADRQLCLYEFNERNLLNQIKVILPDVVGLLPQLHALAENTVNLYAVRRRVVATNVEHASFWLVPAVDNGCSSADFVLRTTDGRSIYGTAALRADK